MSSPDNVRRADGASDVTLLTGGGDRPYVIGLATSLVAQGLSVDLIASDFLDVPELRNSSQIRFFNLRGDSGPDAPMPNKIARVIRHYGRLLMYALRAKPRVFHILWNDKLELLDRTLLMCFYRALGKRIVLTVHNVNAGKRDGNDGALNRATLKVQYRLVHHLFVHTQQMKRELESDFGVPAANISVIPFGINSTIPYTSLSCDAARRRLNLTEDQKVVLFFGNIAPYKGVEYLVDAFLRLADTVPELRLIIAGRPKGAESYWQEIEQRLKSSGHESQIVHRIEYVPDAETELYFKAADVLALPYTHVFQSGVLFLGYNFGLPVVATDVGSLAEDVVVGRTGYVCEPRDPEALAGAIQRFFASDLYRELATRRLDIRAFAVERYSWTTVGTVTRGVYAALQTERAATSAARSGTLC
jgi:glycosyltransferase involved in cell wall biosynthesis